MAETLAIFAQRVLRKRGVEIILNDRLKAATSEKAILQSGIEIPCKTLISTVPSALPPVVQKLDCLTEWGKLVVNTGLELNDYEGKVWALGDCAAVKTVAGTKVHRRRSMPSARPLPPPSTSRPPYAAASGRNSRSRVSVPSARLGIALPSHKCSVSGSPDYWHG